MSRSKLSRLLKYLVIPLTVASVPLPAQADDDDDGLKLPIQIVDPEGISARGLDKASGDVRWILPGPRRLDPKVFGTPAAPLGFEPDVGVPLAARLTTGDGSAYTTTAGPTPFSDNFAIVSGSYKLKAKDKTLSDDPDSRDKINYSATVTSPDGANTYEISVKKILPVGVDHPVFGGVGSNMIHHGMTGIGTKMQPTQPTVAAIWGIGTIKVNGMVPERGENRLVHSMITCNVRDEDYRLVFDDDVDCSSIHTHLMMPNVQIVVDEEGNYVEVASPVPTGFILPNGMEQPFLRVMFENTVVDGLSK
jgi:hypothetical protein